MANVRTIHVDWYSQRPPRFDGGPQLAYQGDHLSNMVIFDNAPTLPNYYLLVEMKLTEYGEIVSLPGILLEGPYWVIPNYYTQLCQLITYQVCERTDQGDYIHHSAKFRGTILPAISHTCEPIDQSPMFDPYRKYINDAVAALIIAAGLVIIDSELSDTSTNPVQNKTIKNAVDGIDDSINATNNRILQLASTIGDLSQLQTEVKTDLVSAINEAAQTGSNGGLTPEISAAILNCFHHVAWTSADGLAHYTALRVLLFPVTITVNDNIMSVENADEISSVSKDGMTLILL